MFYCLILGWRLGSTTAKAPAKFQSIWKNLTINLVPSKLCKILPLKTCAIMIRPQRSVVLSNKMPYHKVSLTNLLSSNNGNCIEGIVLNYSTFYIVMLQLSWGFIKPFYDLWRMSTLLVILDPNQLSPVKFPCKLDKLKMLDIDKKSKR